jgi:hypothetical protein
LTLLALSDLPRRFFILTENCACPALGDTNVVNAKANMSVPEQVSGAGSLGLPLRPPRFFGTTLE